MKLILFFSFMLTFSLFATSYSQEARINLDITTATTTKSVLKMIEEQTEFRFFYNSEMAALNQPVTVSLNDKNIFETLDVLFAQTSVGYRVLENNFVVLSTEEMFQQQITISGTVNDTEGQPLPGVSVKIKGTSQGTATDANGVYSLSVQDENTTLVFSNIGFVTQESLVGNRRTINITLSESVSYIDEVVVVGYGVQKKVNLTGSLAYVGSDVLQNRPAANVSQMLQGTTPGLNITRSSGRPGLGSTINVRGVTSINGGTPLVLIDGIPDDINRINPDDVESISVLKDASSAAIYGARGAFGVILVTTKTAKSGKVTINYNNNFGIMSPTVRTDFMTNGYESVMMNDEAFRRRLGNTYTGYTEEDYRELEARRYDKTEHPDRPWIVVKPYNGRNIYHYYGNYDWYHTIYQDSRPTMRHSVSTQGGNDRMSYSISGSYYREEGIMKMNTDIFNSYNFRGKIDAKLTDWLSISNNTSYYNSNYEYPGINANGNFASYTVHALPCYAPTNPDGTATFRTMKNSYTIGDGHYANILGGVSRGETKESEFKTTTQLVAKIGNAWNITGNFSYGTNNPYSWVRNAIAYYSIEPGVLEEVAGFQTDRITEIMQIVPFIGANFFFNFDDSFGKHHFGATGGVNYENSQSKRLEGRKDNLLSTTLNDINLGTGTMETYGGAYGYVTFGAFFRANYDYAGKYLIEFNGRYDGTSRFGEGNRFGFFPSVSAGWRISEEKFFEPLKPAISLVKIRVSNGTLGNQLPSGRTTGALYPYLSTMTSSTSNWLINSTTAKTTTVTMPAPVAGDLTWEKVTTINYGIDLGFAKNRLTASFDLFERKTAGMLIAGELLPAVYGANSPQRNAGDLKTNGFDLSIRWEDRFQVAGKPLSYHIGVSLADSKSVITRYDNNPNKIIQAAATGSGSNSNALFTNPYVGQNVGEIWGFMVDGFFKTDEEAQAYPVNMQIVSSARLASPGEWAKLKAGDLKYLDLNNSGAIDRGESTVDNPGDMRVIGNRLPRYSYGINMGANWNGIDVSVFMHGIGRQDWYPGADCDRFWGPITRPFMSFVPKNFMDDVWTPENPNAYFPILRGYEAYNSGLSYPNNRYLQNIGYFRLKNLTIGYKLPKNWASKVFMQNCRFFLSGENLWYFSKLRTDYIDPEAIAGTGSTNARDIYPFYRTYSFGLDITF